MNFPHVAISILHYKNVDDTCECLRSLEVLDYPSYEIFVVNNDDASHAKVLKKEFNDQITLIQAERNTGFAEGHNIVIRTALKNPKTDAVLILNNDTTVEPGFLTRMLEIDADMVAPRMMQYGNRALVDNLGIVVMSTGMPFNRLSESRPLFCPSAGCALYRRKLLEAIAFETSGKHSYFDPTFFAYAEDLDLGWRAQNFGFRTGFAPEALVFHKGSASTGKLSAFAVYHTYRNLVWTHYKNMPTAMLLRRLPLLVLGWSMLLFYYAFKGRLFLILRAMFDGITMLPIMSKKRQLSLQQRRTLSSRITKRFARGIYPKELQKA